MTLKMTTLASGLHCLGQHLSPNDVGRVALLYGGNSKEREISLHSGQGVLQAMRACGLDVVAIDTQTSFIEQLQASQCHRAFIALHGTGDEDGAVQGVLETLSIPYTGSGIGASALCMDKMRSKWILQANNLPTPDFIELTELTSCAAIAARLGYPFAIKPVAEGSTLGITQVTREADYLPALKKAQQCGDGQVFAEAWINGPEYTVSILHDQAMPSILIRPASGLYDYHAKYIADDTEFICPSGLSTTEEKALAALALQTFQALGCRGWGRVDMIRAADGNWWLLEVNTIPGLTTHSLVPMAAKACGLSYNDLILEILATSFYDRRGHGA